MKHTPARLHLAFVALSSTWLACAGSKTPPPQQPAASSSSPPDVASTAATLKLAITGLQVAPDAAPNEPTQSDVGRMLGVRFMPDNAPCVGLPTKIKGVYAPVTASPGQLDGELVFAPGLTLDELTACYVALGGKPHDVRSPGPAVRYFPGFALEHEAFIDLGHGWLFVASDPGRAAEQLARLHIQ